MYKPLNQKQKETEIMKELINKADKININTKIGVYPAIILRPGDLNEEQKQTVFEFTYLVGLNAFIQNPGKDMEDDIRDHLFSEDALYLVFNRNPLWRGNEVEGERVIAFLSTRDIKTSAGNMLYISGICVDPSFQGASMGQSLMNEAYKRGTYQIAALRTQNPVMKQSFDHTIGGFSYPDSGETPDNVLEIAKNLADLLGTENYEYENMICRGVYGSCLYGIEPRSRSSYYEDKFDQINKDNGDSILCVKTL